MDFSRSCGAGLEPNSDVNKVLSSARSVLRAEAHAIEALAEHLDQEFCRAVEMMQVCAGRVVVTGLGKSGHVGRRLAATLSSTGTPSLFIHAAEALHGDAGMLVTGDTLLAMSNSGTTPEVVELSKMALRRAISIVAITNSPESPLAQVAHVVLSLHVMSEADPTNVVPSCSLAAAAGLGDALALELMKRRDCGAQEFALNHPGGALGRRLFAERPGMGC